MPPSTDASTDETLPRHARTTVRRFDATERAVHWCTATLVLVCMATAAALSFAPVATFVGRRNLVRQVHVVSGLLLALPFVIGRAGPWSRQLRDDVRHLARFDDVDLRWLRTLGRVRARDGATPRVTAAKFHPGQKLNATASAAALVSLYATGIVLRWFEPFPLWTRQGATFVHDWTAFLFLFLVIAHVMRALADPAALRGMVTGHVDLTWAARHHPRWLPMSSKRGT